MSVTLTIRDESTAGSVYDERPLELPSERLTVRELIRERVYQEVQDYNLAESGKTFRGLVQPSETERVLNNHRPEYRFKQRRTIDWKEQFEKAAEAFENNGFLVIVDNRQAESLDEELVVTAATEVSFVRLVLLVGG